MVTQIKIDHVCSLGSDYTSYRIYSLNNYKAPIIHFFSFKENKTCTCINLTSECKKISHHFFEAVAKFFISFLFMEQVLFFLLFINIK